MVKKAKEDGCPHFSIYSVSTPSVRTRGGFCRGDGVKSSGGDGAPVRGGRKLPSKAVVRVLRSTPLGFISFDSSMGFKELVDRNTMVVTAPWFAAYGGRKTKLKAAVVVRFREGGRGVLRHSKKRRRHRE